MNKLYLFSALNLLALTLSAQSYHWLKVEGNYEYDYGYAVMNDNAGNVIVAGKFEQTGAHFGNATVTCNGNHDMFLARYNSDGNLLWIRTAGGLHGDYAESMFTDKTGAIYVSGEIEGYNEPIYFSNSTKTLVAVGDNDLFFAKYDFDGNLLFVKSEGSINSEKALAVCADASGNIFITGYYTDAANFNGQNYNGYGGRDIYVAKYDATGNFQWVKRMGSAGRDEGKAIRCDAAGNVYITGMFSKNCTFEGNTLDTYKSTSYYDAFLAKFDTNGGLQWVKTAGGDYDEVSWSIDIDASKVVIAGEFNAYAEFNGQGITTTGEANVFVAAYDHSGGLQWVKQGGGPMPDRARGVSIDGNNIYVTGQFGGQASFNGHSVSAPDSSDVFFAGLNSSGDFQWATSIGGPLDNFEDLGYESGNSICGDGKGNIYATGAVLPGTISVGSGTQQVAGIAGSQTFSGYNHTDAFIVKISQQPVGLTATGIGGAVRVFPNPAHDFVTVDAGRSTLSHVRVFNAVGSEIVSKAVSGNTAGIDLADHPSGVYFLEVSTADGNKLNSKIILTR